jgi:hypothetical protein
MPDKYEALKAPSPQEDRTMKSETEAFDTGWRFKEASKPPGLTSIWPHESTEEC